MKRLDSVTQGVIAFQDVPIEVDPDLHIPFALKICGVPRNQPSHILRVFLGSAPISPDMGSESTGFAGEFMTYNSPEPEGLELPAYAGAQSASDRNDYDIMVDISEAMQDRDLTADRIDIILTMTELDGSPIPTQDIEFSSIVVQRSEE